MAAILAEVAEVLARHGALRCGVDVNTDDDGIVLVVQVRPESQDDTGRALRALELFHQLRHLQDMAQLRGLCDTYGIDAAALEALIPKEA